MKIKTIVEIFGHFLLLGCISFGGPAAHIGYFQQTFVNKLCWLNDETYAKLITLSQFLPGPGSSQIGFAIGLHRGGLLGGIAAFLGFTLPSFLLMYWLAISTHLDAPADWLIGITSGLKLLAVVVVFDAILKMTGQFCKERLSILIALTSALLCLVNNTFTVQISLLFGAACIGVWAKKPLRQDISGLRAPTKIVWPALCLFSILFVVSLFISQKDSLSGHIASFYQNGSLVFGGGHVVLPLLQSSMADAVSTQEFIFGYGAAQGMPGPMFTMATFLGARLHDSEPLLGAVLATLAIFLPGFLLILALKDTWQNISDGSILSRASWGINAAVIGFLVAAFYQPIFTSAVSNYIDILMIILGFIGIRIFKLSILIMIMLFLASSLFRVLLF